MSEHRLIGYVCVDEDKDVWRALYRASSGLDHIEYREGDSYEVNADEVMTGYLDEGPDCETCGREVIGETYIDYWGEVYCLDCLEKAGLWREPGEVA